MGLAGITVALAVCSLTGVVGAASLPPDDQYSPQQSPYRRDGAQESRGYPNWLKYEQDLTTRFEPPDYEADMRRLDPGDFSKESLDLLPLDPGGWKVPADITRNLSVSAVLNLDVLEDSEIASPSDEDDFSVDDTFQDQGPGSVEVYKLDLRRENTLLVPHEDMKKSIGESRLKSKIPKKATAEEILWKLKSIENKNDLLPARFRQLQNNHRNPTLLREPGQRITENRKDETFAIGGVPELQVGCEGLEASDRQRRSSELDVKSMDSADDVWGSSPDYQDPVYRESVEPALHRIRPIILDADEEQPPSGEIYEELDALLKLKNLESTSPKPTTRRPNRADIDPAIEIDKHQKKRTMAETFPERGDLGLNGNGSSKEESMGKEDFIRNRFDKKRFRRDSDTVKSIGAHQAARKLLWAQHPDRQAYENVKMRYQRGTNDQRNELDIWGFGEDDGAPSDTEDEADRLRDAEAEKRRREYERRRQEELEKRRGGARSDDQRRSESHHHNRGSESSEIERIREQYERQLEKELRDRQKMEEESRRQGGRRREDVNDQRRMEKSRRRYEEELRRRAEEERMGNRDPSNSRRDEERRSEWNRRREEEERRRRLENQRNHQDPPSALTRPGSPRADNTSRGQQEEQYREQKLREYIERNQPKRVGNNSTSDEQSRRNVHNERVRQMEEERRRQMEEDRRRVQKEETQRRQNQPDETERRRQMEGQRRRQHHEENERRRQLEEQRRRQYPDEAERRRQMEERQRSQDRPDENERRRQMEEQRRPNQTMEYERRREMEERRRHRPESREIEEARRRRLEEERKLQEYVRRNQPVIVPRTNDDRVQNTSREKDSHEQRGTIEAAGQWERNRQPIFRTNQADGRIHGPSAPTSMGQRQPQDDLETMRRRQEILEEENQRESNRRIIEQEERRREEQYRRAESRRREDERRRLEAESRKDEGRRRNQPEDRRSTWHKSGSSGHQATSSRRNEAAGETRDPEAEELRRMKATEVPVDRAMRNREDEWRRRTEEHERAQKHQEEIERRRLENERNFRNNGRRRPQYEDRGPKTGQRGETVRGSHDEMEWRRREYARLSSLPVSAKIIIRSDGVSQNGGRASSSLTTPPDPSGPSFEPRGNFDNGVDYPGLNPNRPGFEAPRFPAPATLRPPAESPGACVWAIVQCCPANNRLVSCFESMGCPGVNWDPNPCRGSLADAARAEVIRFYDAADDRNTNF